MISSLFPVAVLSIKALEPFYLEHWSQYRLQYVINEIKWTITNFLSLLINLEEGSHYST